MAQEKVPNTRAGRSATHPQWRKFVRTVRGDSRLEADELYAIPTKLLDHVRRFAPGVLSEDDYAFERALRECAATGFWGRQPFFSDILDGRYVGSKEFDKQAVADAKERSESKMETLVRDAFATDRFGPVLNERREKVAAKIKDDLHLRLQGYVGWLVTHPAYWIDVVRFAANHSKSIHGPADMPNCEKLRDSRSLPGDGPDDERDLFWDSSTLLTKWSLAGFTTLRLPEPQRPGMFTGDEIPVNGIAPVGFSMFVPWPLLADQRLSLRELADYYLSRVDLTHLDEWLRGIPNWGYTRFARMFQMYVYFDLALEQRYHERWDGHAEQIDRAFAAFWEHDGTDLAVIEIKAEGVRKIRRKLHSRLEACRRAMTQEIGSPQPRFPIQTPDEQAEVDGLVASIEADVAEMRRQHQNVMRKSQRSGRNRRASS